jgi:hypothetical protein
MPKSRRSLKQSLRLQVDMMRFTQCRSFALFTKEQNAIDIQRRAVNFLYEAPPGLLGAWFTFRFSYSDKKEDKEEGEKKLRLDEKFAFLKGAPRAEYDSLFAFFSLISLCGDIFSDVFARTGLTRVATQKASKKFVIVHLEWRFGTFSACAAKDGVTSMWTESVLSSASRASTTKAKLVRDVPCALTLLARAAFEDPAVLMQHMQQEGLVLSRRALGRVNDPAMENQVASI